MFNPSCKPSSFFTLSSALLQRLDTLRFIGILFNSKAVTVEIFSVEMLSLCYLMPILGVVWQRGV